MNLIIVHLLVFSTIPPTHVSGSPLTHAGSSKIYSVMLPEGGKAQPPQGVGLQLLYSCSPGRVVEGCHGGVRDVVGVGLLPPPHPGHQGWGESPLHLQPGCTVGPCK